MDWCEDWSGEDRSSRNLDDTGKEGVRPTACATAPVDATSSCASLRTAENVSDDSLARPQGYRSHCRGGSGTRKREGPVIAVPLARRPEMPDCRSPPVAPAAPQGVAASASTGCGAGAAYVRLRLGLVRVPKAAGPPPCRLKHRDTGAAPRPPEVHQWIEGNSPQKPRGW